MKRKKTPPNTETEVLTRSARRCCICFGVQMDASAKKGQIAHLDGNPANTDFDNLVFLCMPHHDEYDSTTRQSKGLTSHEVKAYRTLLYEAIRQLRSDIQPSTKPKTSEPKQDANSREISALLAQVQSRTITLAQCLAEALVVAKQVGDRSLETFCRNELSGYPENNSPAPAYRIINVFISGTARINLQSTYWGESVNNIIEHMRQDTEHFTPYKFMIAHSISTLETQAKDINLQKGIVMMPFRMGDINPKAKESSAELMAYAHPSDYYSILESVRRELTVKLLDLLPVLQGD